MQLHTRTLSGLNIFSCISDFWFIFITANNLLWRFHWITDIRFRFRPDISFDPVLSGSSRIFKNCYRVHPYFWYASVYMYVFRISFPINYSY